METVLNWGAWALFLAPIVAAILLCVFRWILNQGYLLHAIALLAAGYGLYYARFHR